MSVYDYFGVLAAGGRVVFQDVAGASDPQAWCQTLIQHRGDDLEQRAGAGQGAGRSLRRCAGAGPRCGLGVDERGLDSHRPACRIRECLPAVEVVSLGGATEGSIWSICHPIERVDPSWSSIPYGKPLANQRFHVAERLAGPMPEWVTGELYIAGLRRGPGVSGRCRERPRQRFIVDPRSGERLYKTGDLGRYLDDGVIEILGPRGQTR
ncbi:AMP-binding protein [Chromobacterium paludis]|uniref:AMP-binding protein n=1 Tax=Chromobacterium paludis TaxID=2605945 RepID=UPI00143D2673|nr:AMP-binding protein [Chromobacterium paludis]